jgi:hypothetical protein
LFQGVFERLPPAGENRLHIPTVRISMCGKLAIASALSLFYHRAEIRAELCHDRLNPSGMGWFLLR